MSDYIKREDVLHAIWKTSAEHDLFFPAIILDAIKDLPAADVVTRKKGEWMQSINPNYSPFDNSGEYRYQCSCCKHIQNRASNFCMDCGADMREPPKEVDV